MPIRTFCLLALTLLLAAGLSLAGSEEKWAADEWLKKPVDEATFRSFLEFFAYDDELPLKIAVLDTRESKGLSIEHLGFESTPGVRVTANLYRPTVTGKGRLPAVILLHGGVGTGKQRYEPLAEGVARTGRVVLAIDLQHFGERKTGLLETFMNPEKAERLYNQPAEYLAWITQTVKDVGRSYDLLVQERDADPERVVLLGISRGGQVALIAGGADDRLAGVASVIAGHFDAMERGHRAPACPANYIGRISPRPLLTINGEFDSDYDKERSVLPLHALAGEPHEARWNETGHTVPLEETLSVLVEWLGGFDG
jgi:dienelactone hydrolase